MTNKASWHLRAFGELNWRVLLLLIVLIVLQVWEIGAK